MKQINKTLKDKALFRWGILLLIASVQGANYYFYDAISPLKRDLEENFNFTNTDFGLFVSAYSIPNIFLLMCIWGGIILDRLGIRRTGFLFVVLMTLGAFVTAYGASNYYNQGGFGYGFFNSFLQDYSPALKMMLFGRFLFGLGAETSIVVVSKVIVKWFKGKELAMAFGLKIGIARAGSWAAFYFSPIIAAKTPYWNNAIWFAAMLMGIALLFFFVYSIFDRKYDQQIKHDTKLADEEKFHLNDLVKLISNRSFLFVTLLCMTFYSAVFPFQSFSPDFFLNKFGFDQGLSGKIASLLAVGTTIFTPLVGLFVDKKGRSATLMIFGSILLVFIHLSFALTYISPILLMVLLGIAFSLVPAAMWPSVAKIVDEKRIGTAYGTMFAIQNLGLWAIPLLLGIILDKTNPGVTPETVSMGVASYDYTYALLMLAALGLLGLFFAILLKREDKISGYGLERSTNK
ncbi:MAG: MFS transporter [Bacteroidales bacterium]|nr:MFS transporter [Bacteroidales bacterium]MCF8405637.1 MFS transporter [Bacteroidales bacterium]